jgi:Niemann-Pick C1 protein
MADSDSNANSMSRHRLGRGASLLSPDVLAAYSQPRTYRLNAVLSNVFYRLGYICASWPLVTIAIGLTVCGILNAGWSQFAVEKDPVRLWVPPKSDLAIQKQYFEQEFGPFYRTEQIFLSRGEGRAVLDFETIQWWSGIAEEIRNLQSPAGTTLKDVCFAPTAEDSANPTVAECTVQSFLGYFHDSLKGITADNWQDELDSCATNPSGCLSSAGQPLNPRLLFGGVPGYSGNRTSLPTSGIPASQAEAVVITYVVNNSLEQAKIRKAAEWERTLQGFLANLQSSALKERSIRLSYSTEISLEQELNKSTNTDVPVVVLSYLLMFIYVSLSLGGTGIGFLRVIWALVLFTGSKLGLRPRLTGPIALGHSHERTTTNSSNSSMSASPSLTTAFQNMFIDSKFLLALFGIATVLLSVSTAVGLFSFFHIRVTLIIAEVIPFLVLAIGVDNVYILAMELERQNQRAYSNAPRSATDEYFDTTDIAPAEERVARALGRMGPSILLSASCQCVAFALGSIVGMPAVRNFAIYAAGAVLINAILQVTIFVAAMCIDLKRIEVCPLASALDPYLCRYCRAIA